MKVVIVFLIAMLTISYNGLGQKTFGILPGYSDVSHTNIQYSKLTSIIYASINPDEDGNLITTHIGNPAFDFNMNNFQTAITNCSQHGVELFIALGGNDDAGQRSSRLNLICSNNTTRSVMIQNLLNFSITNNLSGIFIDWQFPISDSEKLNHELLLTELKSAITNSANPSLKIGVSLGGNYSGSNNHLNHINDNAITVSDYFYIMAFDFPSTSNSNHSSLTDAQNSINQWMTSRAIPIDKTLLGIPLYGRNSTRSLKSDYRTFSSSNPAGAHINDHFTINGTTYYYNGKTTLETKIQWMYSQGGAGIVLNDLSQDRTDSHSLLTIAYNQLLNICSTPKPNLGPDISTCAGTITLNSNIATLSGRTFTWKKGNEVIINESPSANTYEVTSNGVYTVEVKESGCIKSDIIVCTKGQSLNAIGASRCGPGLVTLSVGSTGGTYDWYATPVGGLKLATGISYSANVYASSTTYYVQQNLGGTNYSGGKPTIGSSWNEAGFNQTNNLPKYAHKIISETDILIQTVKIWTSGHGMTGVRVMVIDGTNGKSIISQTNGINLPPGANPYLIPVNISLTPGTYFIGVYAPGASGDGNAGILLEPNLNYPTSQTNVFSIEGLAYANYGSGFAVSQTRHHYGQLFDWKIITNPLPSCGRTPVIAAVMTPPTITLTTQTSPPICIGTDADIILQNSESNVSYQPYLGLNIAGDAIFGNGEDIPLKIKNSSLATGNNTITIKATRTGCSTTNLSNTSLVLVETLPDQPSPFVKFSTVVYQGQSGVPYSIPPVVNTSYLWEYNGTGATISGANNNVTVDFNTDATSGILSVKALNSCGYSTSSRDIEITVQPDAVIKPHQLNSINVYPNPFTNAASVEINLNTGTEIDLELLTVLGIPYRSILKAELLQQGSSIIQIPEVPSGIYILQLKINNKIQAILIRKN